MMWYWGFGLLITVIFWGLIPRARESVPGAWLGVRPGVGFRAVDGTGTGSCGAARPGLLNGYFHADACLQGAGGLGRYHKVVLDLRHAGCCGRCRGHRVCLVDRVHVPPHRPHHPFV